MTLALVRPWTRPILPAVARCAGGRPFRHTLCDVGRGCSSAAVTSNVQVVIDTNALEGDRYAQRPVADAAWRGAAAGDFQLVVPEAVVGELVKHFPTALQETLDELAAALKKRRRELHTFGIQAPEPPAIDVEVLCAGYEAALRARCSESGCRVEPTPDLGPALAWAIVRRKPFDSSGHGLPDAAIWLTVLDLAVNDDVILVTNNSKDFGKPGQLRPELRKDLADRGVPEERVQVVEDLFALQREIVVPAAEASARIVRLLEDPTGGPRLTERLVDAVRQSNVEVRVVDFEFDLDQAPTIGDLEVDGFTVLDAQDLGGDEILVRLTARGDVLLELVVWRADYVEAEFEGVTLDPFDADAHTFDGEVWISADLTIGAVIRLNGTVEEATIDDFKRLPQQDEIQRRLERYAGDQLVEELRHARHSPSTVEGYRPPEPIASVVEEASIEDWRPDGAVRLDQVLERDADGVLLDIRVPATASITWVVGAPEPADLDRFADLAEGVEDGGGYLHDLATDEPVVLHVVARLSPDGWEDIEVEHVGLRPEVLEERRAEIDDDHYALPDDSSSEAG